MTRREFAGGALCFLAGGWRVLSAAEMDFGTANLKLGVLSDIHFTVPEAHAGSYAEECQLLNPECFRKALEWYRDQKVDGVVIAGDLADNGLVRQLEYVAKVWNDVFPKNRRPDGAPVEKLFVYGNHDIDGGDWECTLDRYPGERAVGHDPAAAWELAFDEPYKPFWHKRVKGYSFLGANWAPKSGVGGEGRDPAPEHGEELRGFLRREIPTTDPSKPFFYIQHPHLKNTCYGTWAWGHDHGIATEELSNHPNAIALSGHSHYPLSDERSVWQGAFTSIGTASLYMIDLPEGRENGTPSWMPAQMPVLREPVRQAMLFTLYGNTLVIDRRELTTMTKVGPDWVVPVGGTRYAFETAAAKLPRPAFPKGAKIAFSDPFDGKDRRGTALRQRRLVWTAARCDEDASRAFDYEVTVETPTADVTKSLVKRVYSKNFWRPPEYDREDVECVFAENELLSGWPFTVSVRAVNCYGAKSEPLVLANVSFPRI